MKRMKRILFTSILSLCLVVISGCSIIDRVLTEEVDSRRDGIFTELNLAIREGNIEEVQKLLKEGASANVGAEYGYGIESIPVGNLSLAINFNKDPMPMVKILLDAGANPADDFPAVDDAVELGNLEVVELLLQYGANANDGLQSAVSYNNVDMTRLMLNYGADPNKGLSIARIYQNTAILQLLEETGATVDKRPRHETHPEDYIKTENGGVIRIR